MKSIIRLLPSLALCAGLVTIGAATARAQDSDQQAWATAGGPQGGGNNNPAGAAAWNSNVGSGGFNFHNGPIIGNWDDFADFGTLIFTADFQNTSFNNSAQLSSNFVNAWGDDPQTATYGQTFIDPTNAGNLMDFSFFLQGSNDGPIIYQAFVMTWSGGLIGGQAHDESNATILYASQPATYNPNNDAEGSGVWQQVTATIGGGGLSLVAGQDYLIGFSTLGVDQLTPTGPGITPPSGAPDSTSTLLLLGVALGGVALLRRRLVLN